MPWQNYIKSLQSAYNYNWHLGRPASIVHETEAQSLIDLLKTEPDHHILLGYVKKRLSIYKRSDYNLMSSYQKVLCNIYNELNVCDASFLEAYPEELLKLICKFMDYDSYQALSQVNHYLLQALSDAYYKPDNFKLEPSLKKIEKDILYFREKSYLHPTICQNFIFRTSNGIAQAIKIKTNNQYELIDSHRWTIISPSMYLQSKLFFLNNPLCYFDFAHEKFFESTIRLKGKVKSITTIKDNFIALLCSTKTPGKDEIALYDHAKDRISARVSVNAKTEIFYKNNNLFGCNAKGLYVIKRINDHTIEKQLLAFEKKYIHIKALDNFPYLIISGSKIFFFNTLNFKLTASNTLTHLGNKIFEEPIHRIITVINSYSAIQIDMDSLQQIKRTPLFQPDKCLHQHYLGCDFKNRIYIDQTPVESKSTEVQHRIHRLSFFHGPHSKVEKIKTKRTQATQRIEEPRDLWRI